MADIGKLDFVISANADEVKKAIDDIKKEMQTFDKVVSQTDKQLQSDNKNIEKSYNEVTEVIKKDSKEISSTKVENPLKGLGKETKETAKDVKTSVASLKEDYNSVNELLDKFRSLSGVALFGYGIKSTLDQIQATRSNFQMLEVAFGTMLHSEEKANNLMQQLTNTAAHTPFDLQGVADGAKQLMAYGVGVDEVNKKILELGDIASGMSLPLSDLVFLYGTTMTQGRMFTQDLRQFQGRGIPLAEELAKIFKVSKDEVGALVTAGKVTDQVFKQAIENLASGQFKDLMNKQSETLQGLQSNYEDALDIMMNDLGKPLEGFLGNTIKLKTAIVENYKDVGKYILELVAAYGIYKTALITFNVIQQTHNKLVRLAVIEKQKAVASNVALSKAEAMAAARTQLLANAQMKLKNAVKAVTNALKVNPYVLIATAIAGVSVAIYELVTAESEYEKAEKRLKEAREEGEKNAKKEVMTIESLVDTLRFAEQGTEKYVNAKDKLNAIAHKYNIELEYENGLINKANDSYKKLINNINNLALTQALAKHKENEINIQAENSVSFINSGKDIFDDYLDDEKLKKSFEGKYQVSLSNAINQALVEVETAIKDGKISDKNRSRLFSTTTLKSDFKEWGLSESTYGVFQELRKADTWSNAKGKMLRTISKYQEQSDAFKKSYEQLEMLEMEYSTQFQNYNAPETDEVIGELGAIIKNIEKAQKELETLEQLRKKQGNNVTRKQIDEWNKQEKEIQTRLEAYKADYQTITHKDYDKDKKGDKSKDDATDNYKRLLELSKSKEKEIQDAKINIQKEGTKKELEMLEKSYKDKLEAHEKWRTDVIDLNKKLYKKDILLTDAKVKDDNGKVHNVNQQDLYNQGKNEIDKDYYKSKAEIWDKTLGELNLLYREQEDEENRHKREMDFIAAEREKTARGWNDATQQQREELEKYLAVLEKSEQGEKELNEKNKKQLEEKITDKILKADKKFQNLFIDIGKTTDKTIKSTLDNTEKLISGLESKDFTGLGDIIDQDTFDHIISQLEKSPKILFELKQNADALRQSTAKKNQSPFVNLIKGLKELKKSQEDYNKVVEMGKEGEEYAALMEQKRKQSINDIIQAIGEAIEQFQKLAETLDAIGEATDNQRLQDTAEVMNDIAGNLQAAFQGFASSGSWIGAVVAGVSNIANGTISAVGQAKLYLSEVKQSAIDFRYELELLELQMKDVSTGVDAHSLSGYIDALEKATLASQKYNEAVKKDSFAFIPQSVRDNWKSKGIAYDTDLENMSILTEYKKGFMGIGRKQEYTKLKDLAPELWGSDGAFDTEKAQIFLQTNRLLSDEQRTQIQNIIDLKQATEDAEQAQLDYWNSYFGNLDDSLMTSVVANIESGTDAWEDFKLAAGAAMDSMVQSVLQETMLAPIIENTIKSVKEATQGMTDPKQIAERAMAVIDDNIDDMATGYQATSDVYKQINDTLIEKGYKKLEEDTSTLSGAFATASQESIDLLTGQTNAVRINQVDAINVIKDILIANIEIQNNTKSASDILQSIDKKIKNSDFRAMGTL